jgi:NAD(P)-dependent dehydrogenase (short-subunit alcohol dehydrogenase family)
MRQLSGKVAFVTGASSGIGYALAEAFGTSGMRVMLAGINEGRLDAAVARLREGGIMAERVQCDVASRASVEAAAAATIARFGKVHVVCNNAGVGMGGPLGSIPEADWEWVIRVNLLGVVHGTEIFAPLIASHGEGGHIVNTSSIAGMAASPGMEPYAATKFAVVAMSEGWRAQLAEKGIGVSVLCPGFVRTEIGTGHRNRPGGPRPSASPERDAMLGQLIDGGMDPGMVAARVLEAIRDDELYVFTHPELKAALAARFDAILAAVDRAAGSPALASHRPQDINALGMPAAGRVD